MKKYLSLFLLSFLPLFVLATPGLSNIYTDTFIGNLTGNASSSTTAGTANNLSSLINVSSYGAVGFYTNQQSSTFNGHLLPDLTTNIQNALNASATANGYSNTIVFGPGIFRITTNIIASSKVKIIGQGQLHDGRGGIDAITNGWTIIWVDNTNSPGVVFMQQQQSHSELWNIEINGYSNPLASLAAMINANTTNFDNGIGVWVIGAVGQDNAGGFYDNHVAIHGFRVGMWCQQNNVVHDFLDMSGNDVGFVAWNAFTSSPYLTGYYSHLLTNVFKLWNTNYQDAPANSDNQIFNVAAGGMRFGSVDYLFNNTYGMTINQQGEQNLTMFGIFSACGVIVNGLLSELNEGCASNVFGTCVDPNYRPLIQTYYRVGLYMKNGNFLSKTAYPAWYTNSCIINAQDSIRGEFDNVNGLNTWMSTTNWLYSFNYGSGPVPRVRDPYQKSLFLFYGQVYSSIGDLNSCQTAQIGSNFYGDVIADYASALGSLVKQYPSGAEEFITFVHSMSGGSANSTPILSRIAQSDPIAVSNYTASVRTLPPRNFTFDQVTVASSGASVIITNNTITTGTISATNFTGNAPGLTNLSERSLTTNGDLGTVGDGGVLMRTNNGYQTVAMPTGGASASTNLSTIVQTNFISGAFYTNNYGVPLIVSANAVLTVAAVVGSPSLSLWIIAAPINGGVTNQSAMQSTALSIAMSYTNVIGGFVPTNAIWCFTNTSAGAGDVATVVGGQILEIGNSGGASSGLNGTGLTNVLIGSGAPTFVTNATALVSNATFSASSRNQFMAITFTTSSTTQVAMSNYFTFTLSGTVPTTLPLIPHGVSVFGTNNVFGAAGTIMRFVVVANPASPSNSVVIVTPSAPSALTTYGLAWSVGIPQ
jgi:hypothetical protein